MINTLHIQNIGIIEDLSIDFGKGLNVLTGETGARKNINNRFFANTCRGKIFKRKNKRRKRICFCRGKHSI